MRRPISWIASFVFGALGNALPLAEDPVVSYREVFKNPSSHSCTKPAANLHRKPPAPDPPVRPVTSLVHVSVRLRCWGGIKNDGRTIKRR